MSDLRTLTGDRILTTLPRLAKPVAGRSVGRVARLASLKHPDGTDNPVLDRYADWSPDGTKIAFTSQRDGNLEIWVMDADGSNQTRLTNNVYPDEDAAWSP